MSDRDHLAFPVPPELRDRTEAIIEKVRSDSTPRAHADELIEIIVELTHTGLQAYFLAPLERVGVGALAVGTAKVGVATAGKSLPRRWGTARRRSWSSWRPPSTTSSTPRPQPRSGSP